MGTVKGEWVSWPSLVHWCMSNSKGRWSDLLCDIYTLYSRGEDSTQDGVYMFEGWREDAVEKFLNG